MADQSLTFRRVSFLCAAAWMLMMAVSVAGDLLLGGWAMTAMTAFVGAPTLLAIMCYMYAGYRVFRLGEYAARPAPDDAHA